MKCAALFLLLVPVAASAQYSYDYTSGPLVSASTNTPMLLVPAIGSDITGIITLSQELPQTGTVTVTPLTIQFAIGGYGFSGGGPSSAPWVSSCTFTTQDGNLTAFSIDQTDPIESLQADSATNEVTFNLQYPGAPTLQMNAEGSAGSFIGPGLSRAPEIDPNGVIQGLSLLIGMLFVVRGRRARQLSDNGEIL